MITNLKINFYSMYFSSLILYKENVRFFKFIFPIWKFQITIFEKVSRTFEILNSF